MGVMVGEVCVGPEVGRNCVLVGMILGVMTSGVSVASTVVQDARIKRKRFSIRFIAVSHHGQDASSTLVSTRSAQREFAFQSNSSPRLHHFADFFFKSLRF